MVSHNKYELWWMNLYITKSIWFIFQKIDVKSSCEKCGGYRYMPCNFCHGSKKSLRRNNFTDEFCALRCMQCDENGLLRCDLCLDQQEWRHEFLKFVLFAIYFIKQDSKKSLYAKDLLFCEGSFIFIIHSWKYYCEQIEHERTTILRMSFYTSLWENVFVDDFKEPSC